MTVALLAVGYIVGLIVGLTLFDAESDGLDDGWVVAQALIWPVSIPLLIVKSVSERRFR